MASKKSVEAFDEMKQNADSLMDKLNEEGKGASNAARGFRAVVLSLLSLQMKMIVYLYQYVRHMQEEQRQLDEDASLEGMKSLVGTAVSGGTNLLPLEAGSGAREIKTPLQTSETLPGRNGDQDHTQIPVGVASK